jgi:hypothetical protein
MIKGNFIWVDKEKTKAIWVPCEDGRFTLTFIK